VEGVSTTVGRVLSIETVCLHEKREIDPLGQKVEERPRGKLDLHLFSSGYSSGACWNLAEKTDPLLIPESLKYPL
jgi:hypothetical protein